jgi:hypothetical protein
MPRAFSSLKCGGINCDYRSYYHAIIAIAIYRDEPIGSSIIYQNAMCITWLGSGTMHR